MVQPRLAVRKLFGGQPENTMVIGGFRPPVEPGEDPDNGFLRVGGWRFQNIGGDNAEMDQELFLFIEIGHMEHRVSEAVGLDNRVHDFSSVETFICSGRRSSASADIVSPLNQNQFFSND